MKTIRSSPESGEPEDRPALIGDNGKPVPEGKDIGKLVGGTKATASAGRQPHAEDEAYWRENHPAQDFGSGTDYEDFHHAYRAGYEGYHEFGRGGMSFEETETKLRERYETENGSPKLPWTTVRPATHAAWHRKAGSAPKSARETRE